MRVLCKDLEDPVWQPTDDVDCDDSKHHTSYFATRLSLMCGNVRRSRSTYSDHHQGVEDADEYDRQGKRQRERVPDKRFVCADQTAFWPLDRARRHVAIVDLPRNTETL